MHFFLHDLVWIDSKIESVESAVYNDIQEILRLWESEMHRPTDNYNASITVAQA